MKRAVTVPQHRIAAGFSLVELIIVLLIIGIASGLVGLYIGRGTDRLALRSFAKEISATLRYARSHAVAEKQTYCFVINMDDGFYRLYNNKTDEEGALIPAITNPIPKEIAISLNKDSSDFHQIEFFPHGNSTGGVIEITSTDGGALSIVVNRITGKVEVSRSG